MTAEAFRAQIEALDARFPLTGNSTLTGNSKRQRTARNVTPQARGSTVISTQPTGSGLCRASSSETGVGLGGPGSGSGSGCGSSPRRPRGQLEVELPREVPFAFVVSGTS